MKRKASHPKQLSKDHKQEPALLNDFSSRVKKLLIEVIDYSFFHGPSDIKSIDSRFIGRKRILKRLKAILTNSETKSGAYLITGHRGMGKSSFVSKAIHDLNPVGNLRNLFSRLLRIYLFSCLFAIFLLQIPLWMVAFLFLASFVYYLIKYIQKFNFYNTNKILTVLIYIKNFLIVFHKKILKEKHQNIFQDIFLATFILSLTLLIFGESETSRINDLANMTLIFYVFAFYNLFLSGHEAFRKKDEPNYMGQVNEYKSTLKQRTNIYFRFVKNIPRRVIESISGFINYAGKIYIKVNLGYDDLKEIDILKLIARSIKINYEANFRLFGKLKIWNFFSLLLIWLVTVFIYYQSPIYNANQVFKNQVGAYYFLPSQLPQVLNDNSLVLYDIAKDLPQDATYPAYLNAIEKEFNVQYVHSDTTQRRLITAIGSVTGQIDLFIYKAFAWVKNIFSEIVFLGIYKDMHLTKDSYLSHVFPRNLDYLLIFYFILTYNLLRFLTRNRAFGIISHNYILKQLSYLNDLIDAQLTMDSSISTRSERGFLSFTRAKKKQYPRADEREIEKHLIEILQDINKIPRFTIRPEFVLIFDELDKIEPPENLRMGAAEKNEPEDSQLYSSKGSRKRQQAIFKLLSNLKYFLTTAPAKFIFIASREIYDASLADISDRNFFVGSIFHDVINVDSFLSDLTDQKVSDITSMIETYVCQWIIPDFYKKPGEYPGLSEYNQYLKDFFKAEFNEDHKDNQTVAKKIIAKQKREKIIFTLQQFIVYLTHVSNGAPKKITKHFESFLESKSEFNDQFILVAGRKRKSSLYLTLDYWTQYELGMVNYLTIPIIYSISNSIKEYGDKLLVSASFLIDHLFKFHKNAFAWRNIEVAPEIIDITKPPELRNFISDVIFYLSHTHIEEILSGLFQFRFAKKISHELSCLSKISEESSAAFNFTLDESINIKRHYHSVLNDLKERYVYSVVGKDEFIHSISSIHMILGDLNFYDEEYGDAIIEYKDSIQYLRYHTEKANITQLVLFIRIMLKLALSFEKRKTLNSALVTCGELCNALISIRDINLEQFGLVEATHKDKIVITKSDKKELEENFHREIKPKALKTSNSDFIIEEEQFSIRLLDRMTPITAREVFKLLTFESIRLVYQPFLAKLVLIEKNNIGGISSQNLKATIAEVNFLFRVIDKKDKYLMISEYWRKLANIMFYKNATFKSGLQSYCEEPEHRISYMNCPSNIENFKNEGYQMPCIACNFYLKGIEELLAGFIRDEGFKFRKGDNYNLHYLTYHLIRALNLNLWTSNRANSFRGLAEILSDFGDTLVSCSSSYSRIRAINYKLFIEFVQSKKTNSEYYKEFEKNVKTLNKLEYVLWIYYLAAVFHKKAGNSKKYSFQLTKIIYLLSEYNSSVYRKHTTKSDIFADAAATIKLTEKTIMSKAIKAVYDAYDSIHIYEVNKLRNTFTKNSFTKSDYLKNRISLKKASINNEIEELNTIFAGLVINCDEITNSENSKDFEFFKLNLVSPYNLGDNIYNRIVRLHFKANLNFKILRRLGYNTNNALINEFLIIEFIISLIADENESIRIRKIIQEGLRTTEDMPPLEFLNSKDIPDEIQLFEFLVKDAIFCLFEIIKLVKIYGFSYNINYSFLASVHKRLLEWVKIYNYFSTIVEIHQTAIRKEKEDNTPLKETLKEKLRLLEGMVFPHLRSRIIEKIKSEENAYNSLEQIHQGFEYNVEQILEGLSIQAVKYSELPEDEKEALRTLVTEAININRQRYQQDFDEFLTAFVNSVVEGYIKKQTDSWIQHLKKNNSPIKSNLVRDLSSIIEKNNLPFIAQNYQKQMAISNYYKAKELHTEGKTYKKMLDQMYYLNGDFDDANDHFFAAMERFRIGTGNIDESIDQLKMQGLHSDLYEHNNYLHTSINNIVEEL